MPHLRGDAGADPRETPAPAADATSDRDTSVSIRLLEGQNQVLERIAGGEPLRPTLDLLLSLIEAHFPDIRCSILLLDPDGIHVFHVSAPSLPESFTSAIDGAAIGPRAGSCGTAAFRREAVVVEDIDTDPLWNDYRTLALAHGLRACWSTPILDEHGRVLGTFALYLPVPGRPDARHWELIELATHTAAIAIAKDREAEERRQVERQTRQREAQLAEAQRVAHLGSYEWDLRTGAVSWSDEMARIFGVRLGDFTPTFQGYLDRVHPDDRAHARATIERALQDRVPFEFEGRIVRPDGVVRLLHSQGHWVLEGGEPVKLLGICQDVTERRLAERKLRESEERFQFVARATNDVIWDWNPQTGTVWWNQGISTLFGYAPEEVENREEWRLERLHPDDYEHVVSGIRGVMQRRENFASGEYRFRRADGSFADVFDRGYIVYNAAGKPVRMIGAMADITERKRAMERLEEGVASRTAELHAKNLQLEAEINERIRMEELLSGRNEELKSFAYTVSHDLKTPLRGIAGYAQELERSLAHRLGDRDQFCLDQILAAARSLDRLIEDLLHYSRVDAEMPTPTDVSLAAVIDAILRERRGLIDGRHVEITVRVGIDRVRVWERGLVQALTNLVDNALKYSKNSAPPRVEIASERRGGRVTITVSDNGIGFDMRYHDRIYGLFNRLVRQEEFEGTGAGLAIVKKIVEKMGGRVRAESAPGAGATFFVELPDAAARQG